MYGPEQCIEFKRETKENEQRLDYLQISETGGLCGWHSSQVAYTPGLQEHILYHILGLFFFFVVTMGSFFGEVTVHPHIFMSMLYFLNRRKERAKYAIENSYLRTGESQESDPWLAVMKRGCSHPWCFSSPSREGFYQLLLRNKYKVAPTGDGVPQSFMT